MFDNAATSIKPDYVLDNVTQFTKGFPVNIHRGVCELSLKATDIYESAREYVARFINANSPAEIIFTSGTTHSLNMLANSLCKSFDTNKRFIFLSTEMEHTSNFVVWQQYCINAKKQFYYAPLMSDGTLDYKDMIGFIEKNHDKIFICSMTHISNAIGTVNDIKTIVSLCRQFGILTCIDAAQSIAHTDIDVQDIGCDFMAFSGHKIFAPFGTGVLYGRKELLEKMQPVSFGGGAVKRVKLKETEIAQAPFKFEVGTPNISGFVGLYAALYWFENVIGKNNAFLKEKQLFDTTYHLVKELPNFVIVGSPEKSLSVLSIIHKELSSHKVAEILSDNDICVRSGFLCSHPLMDRLGLSGDKQGVCRISLSFQNELEEIYYLYDVLKKF